MRRAAPLPPPSINGARETRTTLRSILQQLGRAIIAGQAGESRFEDQGALWVKPKPKTAPIDPAAAAIAASAAFTDAIGKPALKRADNAPWVEVNRGGVRDTVNIFWRGLLVHGERMGRVWKEDRATGLKRVAKSEGETCGSSRDCDMQRFTQAVHAARDALEAAGIRCSPFEDIRWMKTGSLAGGDSFEGAVATLMLARTIRRTDASEISA